MDFNKLAKQYKDELLDSVLPFWLTRSQDKEYGGYFSCLNRDGSVFDTDKFIWLQGREVWLFAMLYNKVEKRQEWLDCAIQGAEFLKKYGHDGNYNWYFSLDRAGRPLVEPYNIFSYTFATMAFGQLALATGNKEYADIAKRTFDVVLAKRDNPKGKWNKLHPGTRNLKGFSLPMILCNLSLEIEHLLDEYVLADYAVGLLSIAVAREGDAACGFVIWQVDARDNEWCLKEGMGTVRELYVAPAARQKGMGSALVRYAEGDLAAQGADTPWRAAWRTPSAGASASTIRMWMSASSMRKGWLSARKCSPWPRRAA